VTLTRKQQLAPWAIANRERGLCGCGRPRKPDCVTCAICLTACRDAVKARRKLPGHCKLCGKLSEGTCEKCREWRRINHRRKRAERRAAGLCVRCGKPPEKPGSALCPKHAAVNRRNALNYQRRKRASA
jgi:hypothetical protein